VLNFIELSKKVEVSIGLMIFIIMATAIITMAYMEFSSIEYKIETQMKTLKERMDKKYNRHQEDIENLMRSLNKN